MGSRVHIFKVLIIALLVVLPALAQEPVIESLSWIPVGEGAVTHLEVTFTLSHPTGQSCWIALWGHDAVTRAHFPMQHFVEGNIENTTFSPGTHTLTWDAKVNAGGRQSNDFQVFLRISDQGRVAAGRYLVIDVSGGPSAETYPVTYVDTIDVTRDEYKTNKIVLRELSDGSYAGLYQVTQQQYQQVTDETPSYFSGNLMQPVEQVSWNTLTGSGSYGSGFMAILRAKTGLTGLDLPASDAWEYAIRAGATNDYSDYTQNNGLGASTEAALGNLGWYAGNSGANTHDVGGKQPNAWGLYDVHGNVWEWTTTASDPYRTTRGGCWSSNPDGCCRSYVFDIDPDTAANYIGLRLVLPVVANKYADIPKIDYPTFVQANSEALVLEPIIEDTTEGEGESVSCNPDQTAPVVTLNGPEVLVQECGILFADPGATALDFCDGDLSDEIEVSGDSVDASLPGTYVITYSVSDGAGNTGSTTRTVEVLDTEPPTLRLCGKTVVEYSCNTPYFEYGAQAFDLCDGDLLSAIVITGNVDTTTPGQYTVHYSVQDGMGNESVLDREVYVLDNCTSNTEPPADDPPTCLQACADAGDSTDEDNDGLTACEEGCYGTSDQWVDTDGDGMPDGWEIMQGIDPLRNDACIDLDGDNLTSLEEYLRGSDPNDANSPRRACFVGTNGVDSSDAGTLARPFRTIAFALNQMAPASQTDPAAVIIGQGYYWEGVLDLQRFVSLESSLDAIVVVAAQVNGAEGASLAYLELRPLMEAEYLLFVDGLGMDVTGVVFQGLGNPVTGAVLVPEGVGISLPGKSLFESVFEGCLFTGLNIGIDVYGEPPVLRRNVFNDIVQHAICLRKDYGIPAAKSFSDAENPESGFNTFNDSIGEAAILNERGEEIKIENNDWGTDDQDEIDARIDGPADFEPFLPKGTGMTAAALFCSVTQARTDTPIENATVVLDSLTVTRSERGVYAFPAVAAGSYTLTVTAPDYQNHLQEVALNEGGLLSVPAVLLPLNAAEGEIVEGETLEGEPVEGEGEGETAPPTKRCGCRRNTESKTGLPEPGEMMLSGLALLVLLAWSNVYRRHV